MNRYEPEKFKCNRCNKPDADIWGLMVSHDKGRWVKYEDIKKYLPKPKVKLTKKEALKLKREQALTYLRTLK